MAKAIPINLAPEYSDEALAAALCVLFTLSVSEGRILAQLTRYNFCSSELLCTATGRVTALSTLRVRVCMLRRKLARHNIELGCVHSVGYLLLPAERNKIHARLAELPDPPLKLPAPKPKAKLAPACTL